MNGLFIFFASLFILSGTLLPAQTPLTAPKHDYIWLMGYQSYSGNDWFGGTRIDFNTMPPTITREDRHMDFDITNAVMCDEAGELLFYTNGVYVSSYTNDTMMNGLKLNPDNSAPQNVLTQGVLILPLPGNDHIYYMIHEARTFAPTPYAYDQIYRCFYSIVDMSQNGGLGKVVLKNKVLLKDTLCYGKITATRHANGRDWWILLPKFDQSAFFRYLLTPSGIDTFPLQSLGDGLISNGGQAVFSPDGSKYVRLNCPGIIGSYLDIFDFDRCEGLLSNYRRIYKTGLSSTGIAISLNSRFLYRTNTLDIAQYDLNASDIEASEVTVAEYDGFKSPLITNFYHPQLAPDGKIYICSNSSVDKLHVIEDPDSAGLSCHLRQHAVNLPTLNLGSVPNHPNYRLGPLDGSGCDTLGIDNIPVAWFRYEYDSFSTNTFKFRDLSYYEPAAWSWDFGDGTGSTEQHPAHTYTTAGSYQVCLTVSNVNGADTHCRALQLTVPATEPGGILLPVKVGPSPFRERLLVSLSGASLGNPSFRLYDQTGRILVERLVSAAITVIETVSIHPGIYYWEVLEDGERVNSGKCVKTSE